MRPASSPAHSCCACLGLAADRAQVQPSKPPLPQRRCSCSRIHHARRLPVRNQKRRAALVAGRCRCWGRQRRQGTQLDVQEGICARVAAQGGGRWRQGAELSVQRGCSAGVAAQVGGRWRRGAELNVQKRVGTGVAAQGLEAVHGPCSFGPKWEGAEAWKAAVLGAATSRHAAAHQGGAGCTELAIQEGGPPLVRQLHVGEGAPHVASSGGARLPPHLHPCIHKQCKQPSSAQAHARPWTHLIHAGSMPQEGVQARMEDQRIWNHARMCYQMKAYFCKFQRPTLPKMGPVMFLFCNVLDLKSGHCD